MQHPAWSLIFLGVAILLIGAIWLMLPMFPWLGRLPGDIRVERENFQFYFPLTTCILISVVLSGIMWLMSWFTKK